MHDPGHAELLSSPPPPQMPGVGVFGSRAWLKTAKKLEEMLAAMAKEQEAEEVAPSEPDIEAGKTLSPFLKFRV